jgi:ribosomal protein S18 acetylase RimI-like enzyme
MAPPRIRVRRARFADAPAIIAMANALNRHEGKPPTPLTEESLRLHMLGRRRILTCLIAERDRAVAGYVAYQPSFDMETGSTGLYMSDLFVWDAARRYGAGRELMGALAREALRNGHSWLAWNVMAANPEALGFYRAIGGARVAVETYSISDDRLLGLAER